MKLVEFTSIEKALVPCRRWNSAFSRPVRFFGAQIVSETAKIPSAIVKTGTTATEQAVKFFAIDSIESDCGNHECSLATESTCPACIRIRGISETPIPVPSESVAFLQSSIPETASEEMARPGSIVKEPTVDPSILIIEDDAIVSKMLQHILERQGYQTKVAADGRSAVTFVSSNSPPLLVLMDVMLPFVDGFELIDIIRNNPNWKNVPIVMLTAKAREQDIVRALSSGVNDYIAKPFQPQELIARVRRLVERVKL